jgi:mono/diheme cytochrome c family protein
MGTIVLIIFVVLAGFAAWFVWYEFFREVADGPFVAENCPSAGAAGGPSEAENCHSAEDMRFMYGSIGGEARAGIPYWIAYVLPRAFHEKLPLQGNQARYPGSGGFAAFGLSWEQGKDMPVGFTNKTIGFARVGQNCAVCHTASYRTKIDQNPIFVPSGPAHTFNLEAFFRFTIDCAKDPRFNSSYLMEQIEQVRPKEMTWIERQIYRLVLIPQTKKALLDREKRFAWIYIHGLPRWPDWGRGRDDAMNLTKYFLTTSPLDADDTLGPTDMPSVWNIGKYKAMEKFTHRENSTQMNFAGDSYDANSVIIDSALGVLGGAPGSNKVFLQEKDWLYKYLSSYQAPKFRKVFPDVIDEKKAEAGKKVFADNCANCHWSDRTGLPAPPLDQIRTGTVIRVDEVINGQRLGTDTERIKSWNKDAAIRANDAVKAFDIERRGLVEANPTGYVAAFLDGIWLRAPYLHNGSVPTLRDLLKPVCPNPTVQCPEGRPIHFYRGYDLYDPVDGGFVSTKEQADRVDTRGFVAAKEKADLIDPRAWDELTRVGTYYDVQWRSNFNIGHEYGVKLPQADKDALIEYLKTL